MSEQWSSACDSAALIEGKPLRCLIENLDVLLVRISGVVHALSNLCTHADACLHEGRIRGNRIICPLHGASFDLRTGAALAQPATRPLQRFEVREQDGVVAVRVTPATPP
jgi:nitrite reductase/ring-hydroxylating ferredoxin subunit